MGSVEVAATEAKKRRACGSDAFKFVRLGKRLVLFYAFGFG